MNWNEFEKRLADGLNEYESQLDVEAIIEAIRKKQKQKRRIIWSLFLPVIAIGLAGLYFAHLGDQNIGLASNGIYQSDILEQKSSGKQIYDEQNKESSKSKQGDYKRNKKLSNFSSVVNGNKLFAGSTNFKSKQSKNLNLNSNSSSASNSTSTSALNSSSTSSLNSSFVREKIFKPVEIGFHYPNTGIDNKINDQSKQLIRYEEQDLVRIPILNPVVDLKPIIVVFKKNNTIIKPVKFPKSRSNRFVLDVSTGAGIWSYNKARPLYDGEDFGGDFNSREGALNTLDLGVRVSYQLKNNFYIYSGMQYIQLNRFYEYNTSKISSASQDNTFAGLNNFKSGLVDTFYGNVTYITTEDKYIKRYNSINSIGIPLGLSYKISNKKWTIEPFIGAQWHTYIRESLPTSIVNDAFYNALEHLINPYEINRFSVEGGVNICKNFGLNSGIFMEFRGWSFLPNTFGNSEYGLNAKGFSSRLGYRYKF